MKNKSPDKKQVMIFGAFDIIHPGHLYFIKQAAKLGQVTAVVARDKTIAKVKGKNPYFTEQQRKENLQNLKILHQVILGDKDNPYAVIKKVKPDIILLGPDQKIFVDKLGLNIKKLGLKTKIKRANAWQRDIFQSKKIRAALEANEAGFLLINKPQGLTSHDVIDKLRAICQTRTIGHAGTLDPLAQGVLICGINQATKLLSWWHLFFKSYRATMRLGQISGTYDSEGQIQTISTNINLTKPQLKDTLAKFSGHIKQLPPPFSAKKIKGKKAYQLARRGQKIKLEPQTVTIKTIEIIDFSLPYITLDITCSSGTYIRSLIHDLGDDLGVGAIMTGLTRTSIGPIGINQTIKLEQLTKDNWQNFLYPADKLVDELNKFYLKKLYN